MAHSSTSAIRADVLIMLIARWRKDNSYDDYFQGQVLRIGCLTVNVVGGQYLQEYTYVAIGNLFSVTHAVSDSSHS